MWARNLELSSGIWLALSPFVFGHPGDASALWWNDLTCATIVVILSLLTYAPRLRRAHLATLGVAAWLVALGWARGLETHDPASQNHMVVGLLLGMLAIVPTRASEPPAGCRGSIRA